jgi:diguanylate cyclase (GGDEF)-like protein
MSLPRRKAAFSLEQHLKSIGLSPKTTAEILVYVENEVRERSAEAVANALQTNKKEKDDLKATNQSLMSALEKMHSPTYDRRTGLLRGDYFAELLPKLVSNLCRDRVEERRSGCPTLVLGDVRNLKFYNDAHGHDVGDALLTAIGETTRTSLRLNDLIRPHDWAARANDRGDEIEILMIGARGPIDAFLAAARVKDALAVRKDWSEFHPTLNELPPDADFGAAGIKGSSLRGILKDLTPEQREKKTAELIEKWRKKADQCMYISKSSRSDNITFRWYEYIDGELIDITDQMQHERRLHDLER